MTISDPSMDDGEWDLGEVLTERPQPKDEVVVYLNEVAAYAKSKLRELHSITTDSKELKEIEGQLEGIEKDLEASRYTVHLTGIPSRMTENLVSEALHKFPLKLDFMGRDDPINALDRMKHQNNLLWNAQITSVVNPSGKSKKSWSIEETQAFATGLPVSVQNAIDAKIKELADRVNDFTVKSQSVDF